jgi:hypothetical protein
VSIAVGALLDLTGGSFVAPLPMAGAFLVSGTIAHGFIITRGAPIDVDPR